MFLARVTNAHGCRSGWLLALFAGAILSLSSEVLGGNTTVVAGYAAKAARIEQLNALYLELNGDIFWAPASGFSAENSWPNIFGDEVRSVFGPLPDITCNSRFTTVLTLESEGNSAALRAFETGDFVFEHRDMSDRVVKLTEHISQCDKPSLANTHGNLCGSGSRIARLDNHPNDNVEWVVLCRKAEHNWGLTSYDDYWHRDNPYFALLGIIGFNASSGEVAFIDGTDRGFVGSRIDVFNWDKPYPPPGGYSYGDFTSRRLSRKLYTFSRRVKCETCHDNKEPWIVTPHLKYRGFGYRDTAREQKLGTEGILPLAQPRSDDSPYRVIGTRYTKTADLTSKTFRDPTGSCTACHTLTTNWTGKVLAYDAVGRINENKQFFSVFQKIYESRTEWSKRSGTTHPWMVPWLGPNIQRVREAGWEPSELHEKNWKRIADCINESSNENCHYMNAYTSCPAPESTNIACTPEDEANNKCPRIADRFAPSAISVSTVQLSRQIAPGFRMQTILSWSYLNGLGGVPQRDDVRFNLFIKTAEIPNNDATPQPNAFPSLQQATDPLYADPRKMGKIHYCDFDFERARTCHILRPAKGEFLLNNISFAGHVRNTIPDPTYSPRLYRVAFPTQCDKRYLVRLVPKRFCFDRSGVVASQKDHLVFFDVECGE